MCIKFISLGHYLRRFWPAFLLFCFPSLAHAVQSLTFTPQPSDLSVVFLRDIFGMVDGVLAGGGGQILGSMFAVFNAAVLSMAGVVVIYTVLVATINTAAEGQVLTKSVSSIWVPIRTTVGISLLFTYSSGYSVIQIFFMWVVVQGIGAGDLIWNSALNYLQNGGVIVKPVMDSEASMTAGTSSSGSNPVLIGAANILSGVTCMQALQTQLTSLQQVYQNNQQTGNSPNPCGQIQTQIDASGQGSLSSSQQQMWNFCITPVPNLIDSLNVGDTQAAYLAQWHAGNCEYQASGSSNSNPTTSATNSSGQPVTVGANGAECYSTTNTIPMPNFEQSNVYAVLNGICGQITFGTVQADYAPLLKQSGTSLSVTEMDSLATNTSSSRAISVQQMISDLMLVSQSMVNNNLTLMGNASSCTTGAGGACYISNNTDYTASTTFGVPGSTAISNPTSCLGYYTGGDADTQLPLCTQWLPPPNVSFSPLFNGAELQNAVSDYNSFMEPSLNLMENYSTVSNVTSFVGTAESQGWIMAGSYLYNLAQVNETSAGVNITDVNSELGSSKYPPSMLSDFCTNNSGAPYASTSALCTWYSANDSYPSGTDLYNAQITTFFQGPTPMSSGVQVVTPDLTAGPGPSWVESTNPTSQLDTTVYGYIDNSSNVVLPNQPGLNAPSFTLKWVPPRLSISSSGNKPCGTKGLFNIARDFCNITIGWVIKILDIIIEIIVSAFCTLIELIFLIPTALFDAMLTTAAQMLTSPTVSPLVTIAQVGNFFMTTSVTVSITLAILTGIQTAIAGAAGIAIAVFLLFLGPILISWIGMIFSMGVEAAYFIPFTPYIIFTFASFGWMIGVLEAMVAAPLVALGVCMPEGGHNVFGKGLDALYLLLNAFLRPSLIIISYIAGFILSSVGIWLINTGFTQYSNGLFAALSVVSSGNVTMTGGLASLFSQTFFFAVYFTMCAAIVTRSFELIYLLPDAIMKWIGGNHSGLMGKDTVGDALNKAHGMTNKIGSAAQKGISSTGDAISKGISSLKKKDESLNINAKPQDGNSKDSKKDPKDSEKDPKEGVQVAPDTTSNWEKKKNTEALSDHKDKMKNVLSGVKLAKANSQSSVEGGAGKGSSVRDGHAEHATNMKETFQSIGSSSTPPLKASASASARATHKANMSASLQSISDKGARDAFAASSSSTLQAGMNAFDAPPSASASSNSSVASKTSAMPGKAAPRTSVQYNPLNASAAEVNLEDRGLLGTSSIPTPTPSSSGSSVSSSPKPKAAPRTIVRGGDNPLDPLS